MFTYNHLDAGHDKNGNPRRLFTVYESTEGNGTRTSKLVAVFDDGYYGDMELRKRYQTAKHCGNYEVTPRAYRDLVSFARKTKIMVES